MQRRDFPNDFIWGAATCPPCCEGETVSDWAGLSAPDGSVPDDGPRHWRRYRYDFRTMADLGLRAYRFGLDWGRLQRKPNAPFNREEVFRYLEMLAELRSLGIEPWLTMFHHALPRWASAAGGWLNRETPHWFADFSRRLADVTDGEVVHWIPVYEPQMYALSAYAWDLYPGGEWGRLDKARTVLRHLVQGYGLAAGAVRRRLPGAKIGLSLPGGCFFSRRCWHPGDWLAAGITDWLLNRSGLGRFLRNGGCDFVMLRAGAELRLDVSAALSLGSILSSRLPAKMRHGGGRGPFASERVRSVAALRRRLKVPIYLAGNGGMEEGGIANLLEAYAGKDVIDGFFHEPLLDQFDIFKGLASGGGLLQVDFHSPERRRQTRDFAKRLSRLAKTGNLKRKDSGNA